MPIEPIAMRIDPIAAFTDNYIWCLHQNLHAWVVDPGAAAPVQAFLAGRGLRLEGILITHHHPDHVGGVNELRAAWPELVIYGPDNPAIAGIDHTLREGDSVAVFGHRFEVLEVPGHTLDHIAYYAADTAPPTLFCGDTLFAAGCGRLFEGTAPQMYTSLQKLAGLPAATAVYCAHEYTLSNLRFAQAVEPDSTEVRSRGAAATALREEQRPTVPSSIGLELATNPFLRCQTPSVLAAAQARSGTKNDLEIANPAAIFAAIRAWKDQF
jgi:hydroxyacylglutathione hydrolase